MTQDIEDTVGKEGEKEEQGFKSAIEGEPASVAASMRAEVLVLEAGSETRGHLRGGLHLHRTLYLQLPCYN